MNQDVGFLRRDSQLRYGESSGGEHTTSRRRDGDSDNELATAGIEKLV